MSDDVERNEEIWLRGNRAAWVRILNEALRELGYNSDEAAPVKWAAERERAIAAIREACTHHGDNDWDASLDLSDIIEKHLTRHLDSQG